MSSNMSENIFLRILNDAGDGTENENMLAWEHPRIVNASKSTVRETIMLSDGRQRGSEGNLMRTQSVVSTSKYSMIVLRSICKERGVSMDKRANEMSCGRRYNVRVWRWRNGIESPSQPRALWRGSLDDKRTDTRERDLQNTLRISRSSMVASLPNDRSNWLRLV